MSAIAHSHMRAIAPKIPEQHARDRAQGVPINTYRIAIAAPAFVSYVDGGADVVYYDDYQDEFGRKPEVVAPDRR